MSKLSIGELACLPQSHSVFSLWLQLLAPLSILSAFSSFAMLWSKILCWVNSKEINRDTREKGLIHGANP